MLEMKAECLMAELDTVEGSELAELDFELEVIQDNINKLKTAEKLIEDIRKNINKIFDEMEFQTEEFFN